MKTFDKILIVDDDRDVLLAAQLFLKQHAGRVDTEADPERIPELLQNDAYDVILLDMNFAQDATSGQGRISLARQDSGAGSVRRGGPDHGVRRRQHSRACHTGRRNGLCPQALAERETAGHAVVRSPAPPVAARRLPAALPPAADPRRPGQAVSRHRCRISGDARRFRIHPEGRRHRRQRA